MWSDQLNINIQLTGLCDDFEKNLIILKINFFIKDNEIKGACDWSKKGKIGRDIKLASKRLKIDAANIVNKNFNLSKILKKYKICKLIYIIFKKCF